MQLQSQDESKIIVTIKVANRDDRETVVDGKTNKPVKNPSFGRIIYTTHESLNVYQSNPDEVHAAVLAGLQAAASKKK